MLQQRSDLIQSVEHIQIEKDTNWLRSYETERKHVCVTASMSLMKPAATPASPALPQTYRSTHHYSRTSSAISNHLTEPILFPGFLSSAGNIQPYGKYEDGSFRDILPERFKPHQGHPVIQRSHDQGTDDGAHDGP